MSGANWLHNERGEWYVAAQAALMAAVLAAPMLDGRAGVSWSDITVIAGGIFIIFGLGFMILGSVGLGRNLSPFPKPKDTSSLVETGVFAIVRHPIYTGITLCAVGWSMANHSIAAFAVALVLLTFFDFKARREERWLQAKFASYGAYKTRVKKLIPLVY
jgi:protein-S-isoprenylcysteine O-methyltransferase Ste14